MSVSHDTVGTRMVVVDVPWRVVPEPSVFNNGVDRKRKRSEGFQISCPLQYFVVYYKWIKLEL